MASDIIADSVLSAESFGTPKLIRQFAPATLAKKLAIVCPDSVCSCPSNLRAYIAKPTVLFLESLHYRLVSGLLCR